MWYRCSAYVTPAIVLTGAAASLATPAPPRAPAPVPTCRFLSAATYSTGNGPASIAIGASKTA